MEHKTGVLTQLGFLVVYCFYHVAAKKGLAVGYREFMCDDFTAWDNVTWW